MLSDKANREDTWAETLKPVLEIPTKYGPRIKSYIYKALAAGPPLWAQKLLEQSISDEVYKRNSAGRTKTIVKLVLSRFHGMELKLCQLNSKKRCSQNKSTTKEGENRENPVSFTANLTERCREVLQKLRATAKFQKLLDLIQSISPSSHLNRRIVSGETPSSETSATDTRWIDMKLNSGVYGNAPQMFAEDLQMVWTSIIGAATEMIFLAKSLAEIVETEFKNEVFSVIENHGENKDHPNINVDITGLNASDIENLQPAGCKTHAFSDHQFQEPIKDKTQANESINDPKTQSVVKCRVCGIHIVSESAVQNGYDTSQGSIPKRMKASSLCSKCLSFDDVCSILGSTNISQMGKQNEGASLSLTRQQQAQENSVTAPKQECDQQDNLLGELKVPLGEVTCNQGSAGAYHKRPNASIHNGPTEPWEGAYCKICGLPTKKESVSCYSCATTYHMYCISPVPATLVDGKWFCESCLCRICHIDADDDRVLLCDSCDRGYHTYCLQPPLATIPEGNWFCQMCIDSKEEYRNLECKSRKDFTLQQICYECGIDEDCSFLLLCVACGEVYHRYCLTPPISNPEIGDWHCPECEAVEKEHLSSDEDLSFNSSESEFETC